MRKFWVIFFTIFVTCAISISMIAMIATRETIKISADVMYVNVGDSFNLSLEHKNAKNSTTITASSSDSSIVSFDNGLCVAKAGGTARITFTTTNSRYKTLYCDVMVGDGTEENPYYISTGEEFASIGQADSVYKTTDHYKLVDNIDLANQNNGYWAPIENFSGSLDGNGYTINNINIDKLSFIENNPGKDSHVFDNAGLFGIINATAKVSNLKIDNFSATGEYINIGAVAGINYGTINKVEVKNSLYNVTANYIGGIVGRNISTDILGENNSRIVATISECSANVLMGKTATLENDTIVYENVGISGIIGGISGQNFGGKIINTYTIGEVVLGESNIIYGGLVGDNQFAVLSTLDVNTNSYVSAGKVKDSYSAISVYSAKVENANNELIGGVIGQNNDAVQVIETQETNITTTTNNLVGLYYDKDNLNVAENNISKKFNGVAKNLLTEKTTEVVTYTEKVGYVTGYTSSTLKNPSNLFSGDKVTEIYSTSGELLSTKTEKTMWDFSNVWEINANVNNGYPYLTLIHEDNSINEETSDYSYQILNKYEFSIGQGDVDTQNLTKYISTINIKDEDGKILKSTTSAQIVMTIPEGFKVIKNGNELAIYDLNGKLYRTISFVVSKSNYKFAELTLSSNLANDNGIINQNSSCVCWFRTTNHTLSFIDANTGKTIKTATIAEGSSLSSQITTIANKYNDYSYLRFNTKADGTGIAYTTTSKMPSNDLTIYVIYTTIDTSNPGDGDDEYYEPEIGDDGNQDEDTDQDQPFGQDTYEIDSADAWNEYVVNYGDNEDITFVQTKSFTIDSSFKAVDTFAGTYDGNGYTITIKGTLKDFALFNEVESGAQVNSLNVKYSSATFRSVYNDEYFGAIANISSGSITDCAVSGTIKISLDLTGVAGIVGQMNGGTITDCSNTSSISSEAQFVAGIVANLRKGNISECANTGAITNTSTSVDDYNDLGHGTINAAGIVAYMNGSYSKTVSYNSNSGKITSSVSGANDGANSAGIVGYLTNGTVSNNSNSGNIVSDYQSGGVVAYMSAGTVKNNTNAGSITAETTDSKCNVAAGGIVSKATDGTITSNKHNKGSITAKTNRYNDSQAYAGGIIGCIWGGKASSNTLNYLAYISATGAHAYAAGGCGRVNNATFSNNTFITNWRGAYKSYVSVIGTKTYCAYDAVVA
ncbi:MAG: hypothetical protein IJA61_02880 [Clostridia bacterium]|nr:hypothetical protein [Clostridia bacterium]